MSMYEIIDSKSIKITLASKEHGIGNSKKMKGQKHHIVVDIMYNLLSVKVHTANIYNTKSRLEPEKIVYKNYPTMKAF